MRPSLVSVRQLVVKVGTSSCIRDGTSLNTPLLLDLARQVATLMRDGRRVVFVTSGAVGMGRGALQNRTGGTLPEKQALAAIGQVALMNAYQTIFGLLDIRVGQVLLTRDDMQSRERFLNARNVLHALLGLGILPIINENDSVATEEIKIGDNDNLASLVGSLIDAELVVNLTNTDGLWTADPQRDPDATRISVVTRLDELEGIDDRGISQGGTGGIRTKLQAARIATGYGAYMAVARSRDPNVIHRLLQGEDVGTLFLPRQTPMRGRKRWIAFAGRERGALHVDAGAARAITEKGRSLLAAGITDVEGEFQVGDVVRVVSPDGGLVGRGLTNYAATQVRMIRGHSSEHIEQILGMRPFEEVIHRNNLALESR